MKCVTDNPEVYCLGSGSKGNAYIFIFKKGEEKHQIIVEAGFQYSELVKRATDQGVDISKSECCIITHCHSDHSSGARKLNKLGVRVFASRGTLVDDKVKIQPTPRNTLNDWTPTYICKDIAVLPFLVEHDAPDTMGFVIRDERTDTNVLFINDAKYVKTDLSSIPVDFVFIECNYNDKIVHIQYNKALKNHEVQNIGRYKRVLNTHMSLSGCRKMLNTLELRRCQSIFIMHLSDKNSKESEARMRIKEDHPNIKVYTCRRDGGFH